MPSSLSLNSQRQISKSKRNLENFFDLFSLKNSTIQPLISAQTNPENSLATSTLQSWRQTFIPEWQSCRLLSFPTLCFHAHIRMSEHRITVWSILVSTSIFTLLFYLFSTIIINDEINIKILINLKFHKKDSLYHVFNNLFVTYRIFNFHNVNFEWYLILNFESIWKYISFFLWIKKYKSDQCSNLLAIHLNPSLIAFNSCENSIFKKKPR